MLYRIPLLIAKLIADSCAEHEHKRTNPQKNPLTPHYTLPLV